MAFEAALRRLSEAAALMLWADSMVKINVAEPFKLASGKLSPIYINCRGAISNPALMKLFSAAAEQLIAGRHLRFDLIAGGETAGIPFAAYLAQSRNTPMIYVRKTAKGYGTRSLVEGGDVAGRRVLLVEDLVTDAGSKIGFIEGIRAAGGMVADALVLFDRQQGGGEALHKIGVELHSITDLSMALAVARSERLLSESELSVIDEYLV